MGAVKALYHDGTVEFIEKPLQQAPASVWVIFPEKGTKTRALRGAINSTEVIDYKQISQDLHELSQQSESHICEEMDNPEGGDE